MKKTIAILFAVLLPLAALAATPTTSLSKPLGRAFASTF